MVSYDVVPAPGSASIKASRWDDQGFHWNQVNVHLPTFLHPLPFFVPACQSRLLAGVGGGHREQMGHGREQNEGEQMERLKNVKSCAEGTVCLSKVLN